MIPPGTDFVHARRSSSPPGAPGGWWFLVPALALNAAIILVPALLTFGIAFCHWDGIGAASWAGLANFKALFGDAVFWSALTNNVIWTLLFLTVPIGAGLLVAALLMTVRRGRTPLQVIYFIPMILAGAVTGRIWQGMIYSPVTGLFAWLGSHGMPVPDPLANPDTALLGVALVDIWHWWGFLAVVFFAAMRQVSTEQIESAQIDGAGFAQVLRHVILPGILPTVALMMIMSVIWSFTVFDFVFILTKGGPAYGSEVLSTLAYRHAFFEFDVGRAAAASMVMSGLGLCATAAYVRYQRGEVS